MHGEKFRLRGPHRTIMGVNSSAVDNGKLHGGKTGRTWACVDAACISHHCQSTRSSHDHLKRRRLHIISQPWQAQLLRRHNRIPRRTPSLATERAQLIISPRKGWDGRQVRQPDGSWLGSPCAAPCVCSRQASARKRTGLSGLAALEWCDEGADKRIRLLPDRWTSVALACYCC